ncbi:MAG: isochorismatase family protein [Pseudomonadota bacterium]
MKTALLVIDVQMALAYDDANGAERSCPQAEENISRLMAAFRNKGDAVIHVHHHGRDTDDPFFSEAPGAAVQPVAAPADGEAVYVKHGSSAFIGTTLEADLRAAGIERVVTCGATANHCAESATRMASNLGFDTVYTADAVWAYAATGPDGVAHTAEQIHSVSMATLQGEFANVLTTDEVLAL